MLWSYWCWLASEDPTCFLRRLRLVLKISSFDLWKHQNSSTIKFYTLTALVAEYLLECWKFHIRDYCKTSHPKIGTGWFKSRYLRAVASRSLLHLRNENYWRRGKETPLHFISNLEPRGIYVRRFFLCSGNSMERAVSGVSIPEPELEGRECEHIYQNQLLFSGQCHKYFLIKWQSDA